MWTSPRCPSLGVKWSRSSDVAGLALCSELSCFGDGMNFERLSSRLTSDVTTSGYFTKFVPARAEGCQVWRDTVSATTSAGADAPYTKVSDRDEGLSDHTCSSFELTCGREDRKFLLKTSPKDALSRDLKSSLCLPVGFVFCMMLLTWILVLVRKTDVRCSTDLGMWAAVLLRRLRHDAASSAETFAVYNWRRMEVCEGSGGCVIAVFLAGVHCLANDRWSGRSGSLSLPWVRHAPRRCRFALGLACLGPSPFVKLRLGFGRKQFLSTA